MCCVQKSDESVDAHLRDRRVVVDRAARHADRAHAAPVRVDERQAAAERDEPAVAVLDRADRPARARQRAERRARHPEARGRAGLARREIDRADERVVHPRERGEMRARVDHGDRDGRARGAQARGVRNARFDDAQRALEREFGGHRRLLVRFDCEPV
ncbi:transcriptional regulator, LysR family domain protein [Burkholderia pseudomallei MSHR435]|nr:transcriptional regulator, LysR family domain protein [Burkholderia pseudomallei MSHR435]